MTLGALQLVSPQTCVPLAKRALQLGPTRTADKQTTPLQSAVLTMLEHRSLKKTYNEHRHDEKDLQSMLESVHVLEHGIRIDFRSEAGETTSPGPEA